MPTETQRASGWDFATIWEAVARQRPDGIAVVCGPIRRTWADLDRRAGHVARWLVDNGAQRQDKVAQYLYNGAEYLETVFASFKASLVPVNTNYRYHDDELVYLWDNADAVAVVFHGSFSETCERVRRRVTRVQHWLWVDDGTSPCPAWATPYEEVAEDDAPSWDGSSWGRSGDDLYLLYTGGTTGMPKGVMWRQDDLIAVLGQGLGATLPEAADPAALEGKFTEAGLVGTPTCPLMHGTGAFSTFGVLSSGGTVVLLEGRSFEPEQLLDAIAKERVNTVAIVGDAFAKPILRALDANVGRWDLSSLLAIVSSGVMWSTETKEGLLRHNPNMLLIDAFSSSEALGMGQSVSGGGSAARTGTFELGANAIVVGDDGRRLEPGSPEIGRLAVGGRQPIGYYKDPEKSARTFITVDGRRYSCPGDYATISANGQIAVLGRGSVCINTGGEKVFPEEVEEVLKTHASVADAVVVGVPDEKWGEAVTAVVESRPGATAPATELIEHVRARLARFKSPQRIVFVDTIGRAPNGKVDYARLRDHAAAQVSA
jgi:fatty-acyl-CoA synthase